MVNYLVMLGFMCLLYLDDRLHFARVSRKLKGTETTVGTYVMVSGINMLGGELHWYLN